MSEKAAGLNVFCGDLPAGRLWLDDERRFVFKYESGWLNRPEAFPLSLSLPLRPAPFENDTARPFFANLLPEGEIRRVIATKLHISEQNIYTFLEKIGGDCAGAVSILPQHEMPVERSGYRELDEEALHRLLTELPIRPLLAGEEGIRLSLAGAQNKLPVYMEDDRIFIAMGNSPSTHIVKPPIVRLEETVENEAFCMALARRTGLPVSEAVIRKTRDAILIVTRYDRAREQHGTILRLHQEDFCQALGILPEQKYESEGGPSLAQCFTLLKSYSIRPAADQRSLLRWVIFNTLIGNADAHAKNLSILITNRGPQLAPFYDLISTQVYPGLTKKLAMKIGGENRADWLQRRHWERFAHSVALKPPYVLSTAQDLAKRVVSKAEEIAESLDENRKNIEIIEKIRKIIQKRAENWF